MSHGSVAASVRKNKEAHPEKYCAVRTCLWALRSGPCRKHGVQQTAFHTGGATAVTERPGAGGETK